MADRFQLPLLPEVANPADTHAALSDSFASAQAGLNTLDEEANLRSFYLHGVGRVDGCVLTSEAGRLRLPNGWFLAGSGHGESEDGYFPGARLVHVVGLTGYIELVGENAPPAGVVSYGHLSALGDVAWAKAPAVGSDGHRPGGRWMIGKVTTDASGAVTDVDATLADIVGQKPAPSTNSGTSTGQSVEYVTDLKWSTLDPRPFLDVWNDQVAALKTLINANQNDAVVGVRETPSSLIVNMGKSMGNIVNQDPSSARGFIAGIDIPDATGDAQQLNGVAQQIVRIGGNATYDTEIGSIHG